MLYNKHVTFDLLDLFY